MSLTPPPQVSGTDREGMLHRRPKVLFLARSFRPAPTIGGVRTWNLAKYLTRLGWEVTVVTPHPAVWRYVEDCAETEADLQREGIQRILTDYRWRWLMPEQLNCWNRGLGWLAGGVCRQIARRLGIDRGSGWLKAAEQACARLTQSDVDLVLASAPPFSAFRLARRLAERLGRPYVLDYRDPWTENPYATGRARRAVIQEEARLLADCAAVTIVSRSWEVALEQRFGLGPKLHLVTNGYDPEDLADIVPYDFGHCALVYTGAFYPPKRVITPILAALKQVTAIQTETQSPWYFHYYGGYASHVYEEAKRCGVLGRVVLHGRVPRAEALAAIRGARVAVVITSVAAEATLADRGMVPAKVFEALGLGTPILLIAPPDSDIARFTEAVGVARRFIGSETAGIASFLAEVTGGWTPELRRRDEYAWTNLGKQMDTILRTALASSGSVLLRPSPAQRVAKELTDDSHRTLSQGPSQRRSDTW